MTYNDLRQLIHQKKREALIRRPGPVDLVIYMDIAAKMELLASIKYFMTDPIEVNLAVYTIYRENKFEDIPIFVVVDENHGVKIYEVTP